MDATLNITSKGIDPDSLSLSFHDKWGSPIQYVDDGNGKVYAYSDQCGLRMVVRAYSDSDAIDVVYDSLPTVPPEELHEAYGFYLMRNVEWHKPKDTPCRWYVLSDHDEHGEIVSAEVLKCIGDRQSIGSADTEEQARELALAYIQKHEIDLVEGYHYQSNASGTGIVSVDDYESLELVTADWLARNEVTVTFTAE